MEISLGPIKVQLLLGWAAFLPASKTLIVADLHLGKAATFRERGLAVPEGSNASDLGRLKDIIDFKKPKQLVVAGDLFHSADGLSSSTIELFQEWLQNLKLPVLLTEGNHDRRSWFARHRFPIDVSPHLRLDELTITHDPDDLSVREYGIAGHLHPGIRIKEAPRQSLKIAGFLVRHSKHLILPAFSEFTGIAPLKIGEKDQFFTEIKGTISELPSELTSA
ncbi:MAG: ligase-associated DNA damage response endonuclease PdeM [Akkermansiaceae bacterium]